LKIKQKILEEKNGKAPKSLSVICGLSNAAYQREDGVFVVPLTALGV
jgi:AAA+ superfamily ATPase